MLVIIYWNMLCANSFFFLNVCVWWKVGGGGARWIYIFGKGHLNFKSNPPPFQSPGPMYDTTSNNIRKRRCFFQFLIIFPINFFHDFFDHFFGLFSIIFSVFFRSFCRSFFDHFFSTISDGKFQTPFLLSKKDYWLCNSGRTLKEEFEYNKVLESWADRKNLKK